MNAFKSQMLVAVLNGVLAMVWGSAPDPFHRLAWIYAPVVAIVALPLVMRSWQSFVITCLVIVVVLLALTPLARWRPIRVSVLLALLVALPWGSAIWVAHLSERA